MSNFILYTVLIVLIVERTLVDGDATCGKQVFQPSINLDPRHRIIGGIEAVAHSYPWTVSINVSGYNVLPISRCGGSLVRVNDGDSTDIIVTAAHCMEKGWKHIVYAGIHLLNTSLPYQQVSDVLQAYPHEGYAFDEYKGNQNDIGLLKLATPIKFTDYTQPICLPDPTERLKPGARGVVVGWGLVNETILANSNSLQQVLLPILGDEICQTDYGKKMHSVEMLCAGFTAGGQDACQNDSGGPYMTKQNGTYVLSGIVSWGEKCANKDKPGVFTRVPIYTQWIKETSQRLTSLNK